MVTDTMQPGEPRADGPTASPVEPVELTLDSTFQFRCHKGIACFNACCKSIDITLTPYDILRLKRRLEQSSKEFVGRYTLPFEMDFHGLPGLKLVTKPGTTECVFLTEGGCSVYEHRPAACRYYALGSLGVRPKDKAEIEDLYFLVRESHCLGHEEAKTQTVRDYRVEQGVDEYDEMNREWRALIIKKRSSGPTIGQPSARSMQLFDMCSYDMDSFREFIVSEGFRSVFDLQDTEIDRLAEDEDELLRFSMRFLKQVLFGERTIPFKKGAQARRIAERKDVWTARRDEEIAEYREQSEKQMYE